MFLKMYQFIIYIDYFVEHVSIQFFKSNYALLVFFLRTFGLSQLVDSIGSSF